MEDIITRLKEGVKDTGVLISSAAEVNAVMHIAATEILSLREQLVATQANAARLVEALKMALPWVDGETRSHKSIRCVINAALSTPINLDALHEHEAKTPQYRSIGHELLCNEKEQK